MPASGVVHDERAVDPIAYIRAVGLRPEDSIGFLPLDLHDGSSYLFLYRDRPEYQQARGQLPGAESIKSFDLGVVGFDVGTSRQPDVEVAPQGMGAGLADIVAQAKAMQQAYGGAVPGGAPADPAAERLAQLQQLRASGVLDEQAYQEMASMVQGGHAGPAPGGAPAAPAPADAPPLVADRIYPKLYKRSSSDQLDSFMPRYRDALRLCPEDVYGVFPRHTMTTSQSQGGNNTNVWEDYWIVYRDRPEYAAGRAAWAGEMNESGGFTEKMFSSMMQGTWPEAEVVPGVASAGAAAFDGSKVAVKDERWPREKLVMRKKGADLGNALIEKVDGWGYQPEDSFGFCPDFNSNSIYFAWRKR